MPVIAVRAWPVWQQPRLLLPVLAVVEGTAIAAPFAAWSPISKADLELALLLASLSVTYCLFVVGWEKARRLLLLERAPATTPDVLATWCFAAGIMLPAPLAAAVTAVSAIADWPAHPPGTRTLYRYAYSSMASVLAATVASVIVRDHFTVAVSLPAAAGAWLAIQIGAIAVAMCASGQFGAARGVLHPKGYKIEILTMALAATEFAAKHLGFSLLIWLSLPAAVAIQRYFTKREVYLRPAGAPPMDQHAWAHVAAVVIQACATATVIRIDRADVETAQTVATLQAGCDAIGAFGETGLAILLPDCPPAQGDALARRIRGALTHRKIPGNVASASTPRDGQGLDDLLAVSEAELVARDAARRSANS